MTKAQIKAIIQYGCCHTLDISSCLLLVTGLWLKVVDHLDVCEITLVIVWVDIDGLRHPLALVHHPIVRVLVLDLENKFNQFIFTFGL